MQSLLLKVLLAAFASHALAAPALDVSGYVRETLPGAGMSAAYLTLRNAGDTERSLQRVELLLHGGASVQLHSTVTDDGISRMRPLAALQLPAGSDTVMAPGGIHLMLSGAELRAGEQVQLRLHFADGEVLEVAVPVKKAAAGGHHHG